MVHHCPFTPEQVRHKLALASKDEFLKPLIVAGLATGLRQGDVANLEWDFIDFGRGVVDLDCRKTGKPAWIPIFRVLRELLDSLPKTSKFVFPEQQHLYAKTSDDAIGNRALDAEPAEAFDQILLRLQFRPSSWVGESDQGPGGCRSPSASIARSLFPKSAKRRPYGLNWGKTGGIFTHFRVSSRIRKRFQFLSAIFSFSP